MGMCVLISKGSTQCFAISVIMFGTSYLLIFLILTCGFTPWPTVLAFRLCA